MDPLLIPTQRKPLCLKEENRRDEAAYTDDPVVEAHESDGSGGEPEVKHVDDELLFGRRLSTTVKWSASLNVGIGLERAHASRPRSLTSRSTAELTFSSAVACCKREISAPTRWALNAALMILIAIPESQNLLAVLFTLCAFSGDRLMNLIALAQTTAS